jgi:hypothetical protein
LGRIQVAARSTVVVTCGSVQLDVLTGSASLTLDNDVLTVSLTAPASAKVADSGAGTFTVENFGTTPVTVTNGPATTTLTAGSTAALAVVTVPNLCWLTNTYVSGSARYAALTPAQKKAADLLASTTCSILTTLTPKLTASQKSALLAAYRNAVTRLATAGWLTQAQATTLSDLSNTL